MNLEMVQLEYEVREWFMKDLRVEPMSPEVWLNVLTAILFFLPLGLLVDYGLSRVLRIFQVSNSADTSNSLQCLHSEVALNPEWSVDSVEGKWLLKKVFYLCGVPLAFPAGEKESNCRKGEEVNLCLYKARVLLMSL